jgi:hypothetical protein
MLSKFEEVFLFLGILFVAIMIFRKMENYILVPIPVTYEFKQIS